MIRLQEVIRDPYFCADCGKQVSVPSLHRPTKQLMCYECWRARTHFESLGKKDSAR
jgi:DNA-directed RNA polymerase subunit RPC12/RpoP